jgi:hypothetical protein
MSWIGCCRKTIEAEIFKEALDLVRAKKTDLVVALVVSGGIR